MKFKELPEGYYFIHRINNATVYVERLENPEAQPTYIIELDSIKVVHDGRQYMKKKQILDDLEVEFKTYEDLRKERKSRGTSYGHITRRLLKNEPLKGRSLELALELVNVQGTDKNSQAIRKIGDKLKAGQRLDEYESHLMIDVLLVHARLS